MSHYSSYRRSGTPGQYQSSYYRVPDELKALLVELTVWLLQQERTTDHNVIYERAASFLEERLTEREKQAQNSDDQHDENKNLKEDAVIPENQYSEDNHCVVSQFADRESKEIIRNAICDYLNSAANLPSQRSTSRASEEESLLCRIETDAMGNIEPASARGDLEHPVTTPTNEAHLSETSSQENDSLTVSPTDASDGETIHKNVYENLEHPITSAELLVLSDRGTTPQLSLDCLHFYQTYAENCSIQVMKAVYDDVTTQRTAAFR